MNELNGSKTPPTRTVSSVIISKCLADMEDDCVFDINLPASTLIDRILYCTQLGEGVSIPSMGKDNDEKKEPCKRIYLHAFRGARDKASIKKFKDSLKTHEAAETSGPSTIECLLYTGHVGISFDAKSPIYCFNPDTGSLAGWEVIRGLKTPGAEPYPGVVTDDTAVFKAAKKKGLDYKVLEYIFPESKYKGIRSAFDAAKKQQGITYSFPGQGGDYNCATWPVIIGLSLPSNNGKMKTYMKAFNNKEIRRMGDCNDK